MLSCLCFGQLFTVGWLLSDLLPLLIWSIGITRYLFFLHLGIELQKKKKEIKPAKKKPNPKNCFQIMLYLFICDSNLCQVFSDTFLSFALFCHWWRAFLCLCYIKILLLAHNNVKIVVLDCCSKIGDRKLSHFLKIRSDFVLKGEISFSCIRSTVQPVLSKHLMDNQNLLA